MIETSLVSQRYIRSKRTECIWNNLKFKKKMIKLLIKIDSTIIFFLNNNGCL